MKIFLLKEGSKNGKNTCPFREGGNGTFVNDLKEGKGEIRGILIISPMI